MHLLRAVAGRPEHVMEIACAEIGDRRQIIQRRFLLTLLNDTAGPGDQRGILAFERQATGIATLAGAKAGPCSFDRFVQGDVRRVRRA